MFSWNKIHKIFPPGTTTADRWDRKYEADGIQRDDPEEYRTQLFYPALTKYLEKGEKYLDAGCRTGGWLGFLRMRGYDVVGVDSSQKAIELVQKLSADLPVQTADIRKLPFSDAEFDGYMAIGVWEFFEDEPHIVAKEAARVLKPGGMLFVEVPYANPFRRVTYLPLKKLQYWILRLFGKHPSFSHYMYRKGDIRVLLEEVGFEVLELLPHDLPQANSHYGLWVDWPFLRGARPYELNGLGQLVKNILNNISPWMIATGMFFVAKKK